MPLFRRRSTLVQMEALSLKNASKRSKDIAKDKELKEIYIAYCSFGKGKRNHILSGKNWIKLCRECGIMTDITNLTRLDILFTKVTKHPIGAKRVDYATFCDLLVQVAHMKGCKVWELVDMIKAQGGPVARGTVPYNVPFARREHFTGTWRFGGPTCNDREKWGFQWMVDRSPYDVRGRKDWHDMKKSQRGAEKIGHRTIVIDTAPSPFKEKERKWRMRAQKVKTVGLSTGKPLKTKKSKKSKNKIGTKKTKSTRFMKKKLRELADFMTSNEDFAMTPEEFKKKVQLYSLASC